MSNRYAIVQSNTVVNVIVWDGESPWTPPEGTEAIHAPDGCGIGDIYNGVGFDPASPPPPPPEPPKPTAEELKAQLDALNVQLAQIQRLLANTQ